MRNKCTIDGNWYAYFLRSEYSNDLIGVVSVISTDAIPAITGNYAMMPTTDLWMKIK